MPFVRKKIKLGGVDKIQVERKAIIAPVGGGKAMDQEGSHHPVQPQ
jgi:hypothetical protein